MPALDPPDKLLVEEAWFSFGVIVVVGELDAELLTRLMETDVVVDPTVVWEDF
jgi:hypothetical protein